VIFLAKAGVSSASRAAPAGGLKTRDRSRRRGGCKRLPRHDSAAARSTLAAMRSATRQRLPTLWGRAGIDVTVESGKISGHVSGAQ
jgi:hypothetical protein